MPTTTISERSMVTCCLCVTVTCMTVDLKGQRSVRDFMLLATIGVPD